MVRDDTVIRTPYRCLLTHNTYTYIYTCLYRIIYPISPHALQLGAQLLLQGGGVGPLTPVPLDHFHEITGYREPARRARARGNILILNHWSSGGR